MFEQEPDKPPHSHLQVFLGFWLGCVVAVVCLFISIFVGLALSARREWLFPIFNAGALLCAGAVCLKHARRSSYAAGMVIGLSVALLLDGACAVAAWR